MLSEFTRIVPLRQWNGNRKDANVYYSQPGKVFNG